MQSRSTIWETIYAAGEQLNRWPFDAVVAFVVRNRPPKPPEDTSIVEVGFGGGNNLFFAASEGFRVAGVEANPTAVDYARRRFRECGLAGELRAGDFLALPFDDSSFDLAIDRASLSHVTKEMASVAIREVHRVLRPGGRFLFTPYSTAHTVRDRGVYPSVAFYDRDAITSVLGEGWRPISTAHVLTEEGSDRLAEWRVVVEKDSRARRSPPDFSRTTAGT